MKISKGKREKSSESPDAAPDRWFAGLVDRVRPRRLLFEAVARAPAGRLRFASASLFQLTCPIKSGLVQLAAAPGIALVC